MRQRCCQLLLEIVLQLAFFTLQNVRDIRYYEHLAGAIRQLYRLDLYTQYLCLV